MSTWNIYHKDGSKLTDVNGEQITVHGLEYSDSWMGECFVTINFKHEVPINFQIGDYIIYRGERFELNYEPGKDKQARPDTYGEGFVYDSVKFNALQDELARAEFLDVVLNDNELHYTSLPKFPFYVQTLDDLLDRIQACLNEQIGAGLWKIYSRNKDRSVQRGALESEWLSVYGEKTEDNVIESMSITVDSQTCWQALALVNEKWDINFIVRGRNIYVGTTGIQANHIFKYGLGNGLYEIVQNADSDQSVVTRLRAYGSEKNLPSHYYADLGVKYVANITKVVGASTNVTLELDLDYIETYFKNPRKYIVSGETGEQSFGWVLKVTFDFKTEITGYVTQTYDSKKCRFYSELKGTQTDTGDEESKEKLDAFIAQVKAGNTKMYITSGLNKKAVPSSMKEYAKNLPNNMSINRLMLPGFPHVSLSDFYNSLTNEEKKYVNPTGRQHKFSTDPHRPYIDSINIKQIGLRSASQFFETDDKTNGVIEIYPTIEEMEIGGVRVDEIDEGVAPDDDGRFGDNETVKNVDIYLKKAIDFDINDLKDDDFSISMKDGMCGGRTFKVASSTKIDGRWRLTIERVKDDALELWFPYKDYPIKKGDHFVLTGITLPDSYVNAASLKLLKYAIAFIDKNDYTRYVYQPKVDEIFMARQHDLAEKDTTGVIKSLHDTLKAGDLMEFEDTDLRIGGVISIDQLTIKEEDGKIPTYDITLREDKEVGTIQKIQQQISSLQSGNGGTGAGLTTTQVKGQIATEGSKHFISKINDDIANGTITWEKVQKFLQGLLVGGGSWTPDAEGRSHLITDYLEVRMKAIFEELVINKTSTIGGKEIISPAGGVVVHKVEEVTVTYNNVSQKAYRCYFLAEQEGDEVDNDFAVNDQVRSESFNVRKGTYHKAGNHFYWRLVIGRDEDPVELEGKKYHYIDLSDTDCATASDVPAKGDVLNQCGNRTDVERQNCLIFSAVDTYSPSISLYHGINSYSFANREYVEYGVNKQNNKAFFNVYGDMYVGDRPTKENGYEGSSYIRYDSSTKQMSVKAKISAKSTVDGKELSQYIKENSAKGLTEEQVNNLIKNSQVIADLQNQVDGAIETWFYDGVPTLENAPAISWKTDKDKEIHLGDLYYNNKTGKAYRFAKDSNTYKWIIITDTELTKALKDSSQALKDAAAADKKANGAQATANTKRRIFGSQPVPPYDVNDMWVNATYPNDGSTYKNEILKCSTAKAEGEKFDIADWKLASKYTDDTKAEEAKKAAEKAQEEIKTTQSNLNALGTTVTENKKTFDSYVKDGYLEPSEIAAMAQDSKRLEDAFAAAEKSYNEVKGAEVLKSTKELTDLNTAFTTLSTAKTELVTYLSDISTNYNKADTNGKAAIVSAVGTKFTNFQSAYSAFYDKLGLANAYITSKIYGDLKQNITDLAGYKYLKDALGQTTYVDGGLVMTTLLALRDGDGNVQSGINGAIDPNRGKKSIATWWGGQMVDKDYNSGNLTPATSLIRFDGSGYLANGAIWWDVSGKVHADPTSFIISEKNLGAYLTFFEPTWKEGSAGTSVADLVSLKPNAPFSKLGVSGDATFEGAISFHGIKITYDATNKAIKIDGNLYATGGITAYGAGASTTGGGGGLNGSVKSYSNALKLTSESLSEIASAYSIKALDSRISSLEGGSAMDVSVSGSGNAVTAISKSGTTIIVTKGTTFLTSHQSLASYLTKADAASLYQPKGNYLTAHQSLDGYVNAIAVSGSGNAVTAVTKSGKTITFTKGATYLTSHQSLSNYYTKSSVDSLLNGKSATTHTHSVKINGITKTIPASGGDAVDLGTYLTTHQSLAAYATQNWVKNEATAHNADMVDNYHASGLFTGFSISDVANKVTISIGGTSKALNLVRAFPSGVGNNFNDIATHGNSMGMSNIAAPYASSTPNYQTLNGYVNPNGQTGWHHYINLSYTDSNNTATSPNMWQTQFAIKAGTTEVYVRSRAGGKISNDAAWAAPWVRLARVTDNVASASKVANALSWSGYSSGSYNGSAVKSISIPNNTNQLTNGAGFITSSASITGNAGSATKLQNARTINGTSFNGTANIVTSYWGTARKLWGNSVNGNADVNGSITIANTDGVYVQIGDVRLVYDKANTAIKVVKSDGTTAANFYATGGISAYGEGSAGTTGSNNFSAKAYADSIKLTSENLSEIASAYSIAVLNNSLNAAIGRISTLEGGSATSIETTGSGNAVTSVSKSGTKITFTKGSTFSLNGHTHTFASLTSKPTSLSGYGITDGVNAVSVTGSGNAITTASISGHTLTLTKGSSFSLSNHTHYVGTTQVQGSSAEQALTGITKIDNILKLSKASVTVNTSYKAEQNRLVIYGSTYGNDANYIKSAGKLSYGDGGPQLVFSTGENPDASGVQSAALVYTDHDTIGAGVSLSFVTNQGDAYFIAPHIKALTAFQGNLAWSYITNKPTTLSGFGITDGLRSVTQPSGSNVFVTGISTSGTAITYTKSYTKKSLSAVGTSGWTNASIDGNIIPDMSFIAYWNGAYSGTSSNLAYCNKGAFGSFAIKNSLAFSELTSKPTTISGYGITDAYTKSQVDTIAAKYLPLTGGTLTGQLKIEASALNGAYNGLRIGDDCYIGDCNFGNTIGLMGVGNNNAGMVKFGKGGMQFGYNGLNHIASTTAQWTNLNADLLDGWHKNNIVWSGAVNSNTASLSHYWAKLFDITVTGNQYDDRNFTFLFSNGFNDTFSVVVLRIRQNGAKDSGAYNFIISLRELVGNMSSRLRVYYNNATGNVQLWGNCQRQYGSLSYTIIKKTGRTSADFTSQGTLVTNTSFSAAQSLPATTGDSPYTLLDGATRIGIVNQADQLVTARTIWGQSFNGTANVSGALSGATTISASNTISTTLQNGALKIGNKLTPISAIDAQVIFNTGAAIRFGETNWDWNQWAGLKYTHSNKTIYLGIADGSVFGANSAQRNGTLKFPGITTITPDGGARIGGSGGDLYLGNANNNGWVCTQDICSQANSSFWSIRQDGNAYFNSININSGATFNGPVKVNNMLTARGIMFTTADSNAYGTSLQNWDGSIGANVTNMFNGIDYNNISMEYSTNGGSSWFIYTANPNYLFNLINDNSDTENFYLGNNVMSGSSDADKLTQIKKNQLRVTIKIPPEVYQELAWISVDVNNGVSIKCQVYFGNSSGVYTEYVSKVLVGWSHRCDICVGPLNVNVGNDTYRYVRLVFSHLSSHTSLRNGIVSRIRALALTKYNNGSERYNISTTGHIYNYDYNMNTYFPNSILAKGGVTAYQSSDIRLKQDLRKLDYLGIIKAMGGTYGFAWKKDNTRSIGWIAQHVLCNPHLKDIVETDEKGYYKINYWSPKLIATAFGAIEQVGDEVSRLKARVVFLESEVQRLSGDKEDCNKKRLDNKNINSLN